MKSAGSRNNYLVRQLFVMGMLFFVLSSSCSIQRSLKTFFDLPAVANLPGKATKIAATNTADFRCNKCSELSVVAADLTQQGQTNLAAALLLTAIFSIFLGGFFSDRQSQAIFKSPDLSGTIPKYLLFSRLLFYDRK